MGKTYSYKILQLKKADELVPLLFLRYSRTLKQGGVDLSNYNEVYTGKVSVDSSWCTDRVLEELYTKFNMEHPDDYRARSVSVSDIISLCEEEGSQTFENYFVDSIGFQKLAAGDYAYV